MLVLGHYVYNADLNAWLQEDKKSWGSFGSAFEWSDAGNQAAEDTRLEVSGTDVTYTMAVLS